MDTKSGVTLGGLKSAPGDSVTPIVKSVILLVKKKVPTIAWKPDQRLCVFEELTEGHLNATSPDVKGLFFYDPPLKQFFTVRRMSNCQTSPVRASHTRLMGLPRCSFLFHLHWQIILH